MARNWSEKIVSFDKLEAHAKKLHSICRGHPNYEYKVVATNGCFELIHPGHIDFLEKAAALGHFLIVGINSDEGLNEYKGKIRTPYTEKERAKLLSSLECVDYVTVFPGNKATVFLNTVKPDIYVKGGDYTPETLDPVEKKVLDECGAEIKIIPFLSGYSTTEIINKIKCIP